MRDRGSLARSKRQRFARIRCRYLINKVYFYDGLGSRRANRGKFNCDSHVTRNNMCIIAVTFSYVKNCQVDSGLPIPIRFQSHL